MSSSKLILYGHHLARGIVPKTMAASSYMSVHIGSSTVSLAGNPPLVSIALCTYNGRRFLEPQIESLLAQTYQNLEIIVSDDGSTDDTVSILDRYARQDARIRVFAHLENVGFARNFERALRACAGEFIAPCDQDDIWMPDKIGALLAIIGDRSLAYCDSQLIDGSGASLGRRMSEIVGMISTEDPTPFAFANCASGHAMLFRGALLQSALPVPRCFGYYDWWLTAVAAAMGGIARHERPLVMYRQHTSNITDPMGQRAEKQFPRGHTMRYLRETGERLECLAALPGSHRNFIRKLSALWRAREQQWISLRLGYLLTRHRRRLYATVRIDDKALKRQ